MNLILFAPLISVLVSCSRVTSPTVGSSMTNARLSSDVARQLDQIERSYAVFATEAQGAQGASNMRGANVTDRKIITKPDSSGKWSEEWTVQRNSGTASYRINFVPTPQVGGTAMAIVTPPTLLQ